MSSQNNSSARSLKSIFKISIWGAIILLVIYGLFLPPQDHPYETAAKIVRPEFNAIDILPGAKEISKNSSAHGRKNVSVYERYLTDKNSSEVRSFYLEQAQKNGWTIVKEELAKPTEREPSEKLELRFKKGEISFLVSYSAFKNLDGSNLYVGMKLKMPPSK